jgi:hypothetical protein
MRHHKDEPKMVHDRVPGLSDGGQMPPGYDPPSASLTPPARETTKPAPRNGGVCPVCGRRGRPEGHH